MQKKGKREAETKPRKVTSSKKVKMNTKRKVKTGFNANILLLVLIPAVFIGASVSKYIKEHTLEMEYFAKAFYFRSDLLNGLDEELPEYTYAEGIDSISFYLKNNDDALRYSEVDIDYEVTLSKDGAVVNTKQGKIEKGKVNSVLVQFKGLDAGEYTVSAKAVSPYSKELTGKFTLQGVDKTIYYNLVDSANSPIAELTIYTNEYSGDVYVTYPAGVVPDSTDANVLDVTTTYFKTNYKKNSSHTFVMLKENPANSFTKENFTVSSTAPTN